MATVEFRYDPKNTAWFNANAAMVLKAGEPAYHDTTGLFKLGDGVTALSALSFLPIVSTSTPTLQQVLTAGQVATTTIETTGFIKTGGLSTEFLKADGTVDSSTYLTSLGTAATSLTTTGSSGAATLVSNVLNVPNYTLAGLGGTTLAAVNAQNLSVFAATTSSQLAGVISDETGSGALVFGTSPTFTTNITTPQITGVSGINGIRTITNNTASGAIARGLYHTPTLVASANGDQLTSLDISPTFTNGAFTSVNNLALTMAMGTASIKMGNLSTTTTLAAIYFNQATPNSTNYTLQGSTTSVTLNNTTAVNIAINTTPILSANSSGAWNANAIAVTSGAVSSFNFTSPAHTNQTLGTNIPNFRISGASKQWATGTVANQYWNYLTANTAAFVGASTMTNSYGLFVEAATAGTNATITNNYAAGFNGRVSQEGLGSSTFFGFMCGIGDDLTTNLNTGFGASALLTNIVGTKNCAFGYFALRLATGSFNVAFGTEALQANTTGAQNVAIGTNALLSNQTGSGNTAVGDLSLFQTTGGSNTGVGKNTLYDHTSGTFNTAIGWNTGRGIITGGSNTIIGAQVTGLSSTLANNVIIADGAGNKVLWFNSANALISDLKIDTTTGIKLGTTNLQKLSFWNATPIVQPTTAVAAATVVSGTGSNVKHDDTFDGYTLEKIVKALRNIGLLA